MLHLRPSFRFGRVRPPGSSRPAFAVGLRTLRPSQFLGLDDPTLFVRLRLCLKYGPYFANSERSPLTPAFLVLSLLLAFFACLRVLYFCYFNLSLLHFDIFM